MSWVSALFVARASEDAGALTLSSRLMVFCMCVDGQLVDSASSASNVGDDVARLVCEISSTRAEVVRAQSLSLI